MTATTTAEGSATTSAPADPNSDASASTVRGAAGRSAGDRPRQDVLHDAIVADGLGRALNVLGEHDPQRLELLVDGRPVAEVTTVARLGQACGVAVAAELARRPETGAWELRLFAWDEEVGADLLVREWRGPDVRTAA